ncbi:MAG: DUF4351 domain-containing protein [Roseiflexaceae bacterium]
MAATLSHDALFKLLLSEFFREFLALFAADIEQQLSDGWIFLDKELFVDLVMPDRREADLVIQVRLVGDQSAEPLTILIHIEHQAQEDSQLDRRMFRYFARFYDRYELPIVPIAICSYRLPRRSAANAHQMQVLHRTFLDFRYQVIQLNRLDWRTFLNSPNPIAIALMARMDIKPRERWQVKAACMRMLANLPIKPNQRVMLGQFVDLYLPLDQHQEQQYSAAIGTLEVVKEEIVMDVMAEWEYHVKAILLDRGRQQGLSEGRQQGLSEGQQRIVLRQLQRLYGPLPTAALTQINRLVPAQLEALAEAMLDFGSIDDLVAWLAQHSTSHTSSSAEEGA